MRRALRLLGAVLVGAAVSAPAAGADIFKGRQVYAMQCSACHGQGGVSLMPGAPNLARGERMMQPDASLLASIRGGRNAMPAYAGVLTDREILDVIAFMRTLR